jgi:predicted transglutaminase-like cysteine proteinase
MALSTIRRLIDERFSQKGQVIAAVVLIGAAFCGFPGRLADAAEKPQSSFFGSMEIRSDNLKPFTKWRTALERYTAETARERAGTCQSTMFNTCHYEELQRFLDGIGDTDRWDQLVEINHYMNTRQYITDPRNWGVPDYWATPGEFMAKFGDCEDYAIAKFLSLKRLGWTDDELRIAAVKDLNLKVGHAILIVYYAGKTWVLDNQIKRVVETESIRHYQPVYSINETSWWRHRS